MNEAFDEIVERLQVLNIISEYVIEIGLFDGNESKTVQITTGGISYPISVRDLTYFAEFGTITFPGKFLLKHFGEYVGQQLPDVIDTIFDGVMNQNWGIQHIENEFRLFEEKVNSYIFNYLSAYPDSVNFLAKTLNLPTNSLYTMDIAFLKKYISCKIYKK